MSDALFLADLDGFGHGDRFTLSGDEGRHAAVVKRIAVGEHVTVSDGAGRAFTLLVDEVTKTGIAGQLVGDVSRPAPALRFHVVQALAKGDRQDLALELLTEVGVAQVTAWQSHRSIVRWDAARASKNLAKWRATTREASKQSRRAWMPQVTDQVRSTAQLVRWLSEFDGAVFVLHEDATDQITDVVIPQQGEVVLIVGPEGGIGADELAQLTGAGARPISISDGVLRTSTAGAVAIVQVRLLADLAARGPEPAP